MVEVVVKMVKIFIVTVIDVRNSEAALETSRDAGR